MIRRTTTISIMVIAALSLFLSGCGNAGLTPEFTTIAINANLGTALVRAVSNGDVVTKIDAYRVVFKKIEIGNSENDKFTLWESEAGEEKDISAPVAFTNVLPAKIGTYEFVRLTIGPVLNVDGSIVDAEITYTGTGSQTLDQTVYVWGANTTGAVSLSQSLAISEGCTLDFSFDIEGTVRYLGGPATGASLGVSKPNLAVTIK